MKVNSYLEKSRTYKGFHYTELESGMLDYLHKRTLEMLKEVISIFNSNNIRHMICGGTLLGAVTTGKFIPWDDDIDVCVFEEDYDRVIDCLIKSLPNGMVVQCNKTEPNYYLGWIKVRDQQSKVFPYAAKYKENGVWIDIYKIIRMKEKDVKYRIAKENIDYLNRRYAVGGVSPEEYNIRMHDNKLKERVVKERLKSVFNPNRNEFYVIWSASKVTVKREWILPLQKLSFEGIELTSFSNINAYLTQHYGENYMHLPPEELRRVGINRIECNS
jgi:lipopolysaccharide cholinephosphotransferase